MQNESKNPELSVVLPCLNEEKAIAFCIEEIKSVLLKSKIDAEIIVVDNGSTDNSAKIAEKEKVKLLFEPKRGYGSSYLKGFKNANGKYILMADADGSYDFNEIPDFVRELRKGYDFVMGDRFKGKIEDQAMPWSNRYIGNPLLSGILKLFFRTEISDAHCGIRAIKKEKLEKLNLKSLGMEFASEMVIMALKNKLKIKELPVNYRKRKGKSKLRPFADAKRHLKLIFSFLFDK